MTRFGDSHAARKAHLNFGVARLRPSMDPWAVALWAMASQVASATLRPKQAARTWGKRQLRQGFA
jgi:hypothetical protein